MSAVGVVWALVAVPQGPLRQAPEMKIPVAVDVAAEQGPLRQAPVREVPVGVAAVQGPLGQAVVRNTDVVELFPSVWIVDPDPDFSPLQRPETQRLFAHWRSDVHAAM